MATISEKKAIIELYVGWFNRAPDVEGINFWIKQFDEGSTLQQISAEFYNAAIHQFSADTGYSVGMSDDAFITQLYDGIMGRTGDLAPDATEKGYWAGKLNGEFSGDKGAMVVQMIEEIKSFDSTGNAAIKAVQDKFANKVQTAEILSVTGQTLWTGTTVAEGKAALATVTEDDATVAPAVAAALSDSANNDVVAIVDQPATTGADNFEGTFRDDSFVATQDTLGLGDKFDGKDGIDTLNVSISGEAGVILTGFETKNIENIMVKSLSKAESTLDMSDVSGVKEIKSYETETDGNKLTFRDIQFQDTATATHAEITIVDTDEDHDINYDVQTLAGDADTITLNVQEIRPETDAAIVDIDFTQDTTAADADIENLVVNSNTIANNIKSISVGDDLATLDINGDANLSVTDALDQNLNTVDASGLTATLNLDMSNANQTGAPDLAIAFTGAQSDTTITFGTAANTKTITTHAGNDTITTGNGANTVVAAAGNDTITSGTGDDTIKAGDGDDTLTDAGGNNGTTAAPVDMGAGNDTATFTGIGNDVIKGGDGNDTITAAAGQDSIDGGAGDDLMIMAVGDLEVSDTIVGGEGTDTVRILDGDNITESEAQRVTEVEIFDLDGAGTTLTLTDNLISTATGNSFTVDTDTVDAATGAVAATGAHTVDMTNITAPEYNFTLKAGDNNQQVTIIADDSTINSQSTLGFGTSASDTLRVIDGATITASDLENVTGLDVMSLESSGNTVQTWNIDLTSKVTIKVSPEVPDGSVLNISSTVAGVVVQHNANITVNITGTAANVTPTALLNNSANLTANADNLVGTDADETFVASDIDFLSAADSVDGNGGSDTLVLGDGGVFNGALSLHEQFNKAGISDIETITFKKDTATGISFNDVDGTTGAMEAALGTINLTDKADTVTVDDENGVIVNGYAGADNLTVADTNADNTLATTLNGGADDDTLTGSANADILNGDAGDDTINGNGGDDTAKGGAGADHITLGAGNDNVYGDDTVDADTDGADTIDVASGNDTVFGGGGDDKITVAADDLSSSDSITGGEAADNTDIDTLFTSDTAMVDADFTNVTEMEVLTFNAATTGDFASEFEESGIRTITGSDGVDVDDISFEGVSNDANLIIDGKKGDDIIMGGSGNDTITGGEGADTLTGSTGADTINLHEDTAAADLVVYTRAEDGAQTGKTTGYDVIKGFAKLNDSIVIDGALEIALDANVTGGDFNADGVTKTNQSDLNLTVVNAATAAADATGSTLVNDGVGLAVYTNTSLTDAQLFDTKFESVLDFLNTNLKTSAAGDNVLYVVQSTNNTGIYFYQENGAGTENIIDQNEIKMLSLVDSGLTPGAVAKATDTSDVSKGDSLLTADHISDQAVSLAGIAANLGEATLTADAAEVNEGANAGFTVATTGIADGDVLNYTVTGVDAADITDANADGDNNALTGTTTVTGNAASISLAIANDATTEGDETLTVSIDTTAATASTLIKDTSVAGAATNIGVGAASADITADNTATETFAFDVAAALATADDTQVTLTDFDVANDKLQIDLLAADATLTTLDQLAGVEGIAVQTSILGNQTVINFGADADGTVVAITLAGITEPNTVAIEAI